MALNALKWFKRAAADYAFEYSTPKIVSVRSAKIGILCRMVELGIIAYVIGYAIIWCKGYQDSDAAQSVVTVKLKGTASTLYREDLPETYRRVWDSADYVIPPLQNNAFFVMTNAVITAEQELTLCAESTKIGGVSCDPSNHSSCPAKEPVKYGNGIMSGRCAATASGGRSCEIFAWCPVENDTLVSKEPLLKQAENFTAFIKNSVEFRLFDVQKRNLDQISDPTYINRCLYHPVTDPFCPIFRINTMVELAGGRFRDLALTGGVVNILIKWDCDLDYSIEYCYPRFSFSLLDSGKTDLAPGWNFRYANYYRDKNMTLRRDLVKAFGILFLFNVQGKAGKFSVIPLAFNVGAGLALLGIAQVLCDWIILYVVKERHIYKQVKFLNVDKAQPTPTKKIVLQCNGDEDDVATWTKKVISDTVDEKKSKRSPESATLLVPSSTTNSNLGESNDGKHMPV